MKNLTFESVNEQIKNLNLNELEAKVSQKGVAVSNSTLCDIWKKVGGIIRLIANLPLIPKSWRAALNVLITALDSLCG